MYRTQTFFTYGLSQSNSFYGISIYDYLSWIQINDQTLRKWFLVFGFKCFQFIMTLKEDIFKLIRPKIFIDSLRTFQKIIWTYLGSSIDTNTHLINESGWNVHRMFQSYVGYSININYLSILKCYNVCNKYFFHCSEWNARKAWLDCISYVPLPASKQPRLFAWYWWQRQIDVISSRWVQFEIWLDGIHSILLNSTVEFEPSVVWNQFLSFNNPISI